MGTTKKQTSGATLATSVLPFMTSKHTCSKKECISMIQKPVDMYLSQKDYAIKLAIEFIKNGKTTCQGLTYSQGINPDSFINLLNTFLED